MTIKACVIGWPIEHSRSPLIHRYWLRELGINGEYGREAVPPEELESFLSGLRSKGYAGCNVTLPHKEAVLSHATRIDRAARDIGAANTLWFEDGVLNAGNSDAYGFLANLDEWAPDWDGGPGTALVLGAGGAARAVLHALKLRSFAKIKLVNRTRARAEALAEKFGPTIEVEDWSARDRLCTDCRVIINTTTLGMSGAPALELDLSSAAGTCIVTDLVYSPLRTPLLQRAQERALKTVDGLGMLLHQAVPGFEKWFGIRPEVTNGLRAAIVADLEEG